MADFFQGIPSKSKYITARFIGSEVFLMNLNNQKTYSLNETAARVWKLMDGEKTAVEIVNELIGQFDISEDECALEVSELLELLISEKLVERS